MARTLLDQPPRSAQESVDRVAHLLVVDDDASILKLCRFYLEAAGSLGPEGVATELHFAETGEEAVDFVRGLLERGESLACAVLDIVLPGGCDGIDTIQNLWELDPSVQCTLATGAGERVEREVAGRLPLAGLDRWDYLAKPFTEFELVQKVRRSVSHWHAQQVQARRTAENRELMERLERSNRELEAKVRERTRVLEECNIGQAHKNEELEQALRALGAAQSKLIQQEKMACIGQLAAGVAHELNNPIGFVHSNLGTLGRYVEKLREILEAYEKRSDPADAELAALKQELKIDFVLEDLPALVAESTEGTERVRKIVSDLKGFSHPDEDAAVLTDINEGLRSTLNIVHNEIKYKATVHTDFGDLPQLRCNPGQINQVFMNLMINAAQAIEEKGEIHISTRREADAIVISIRDTGVGIPPDVQDHIFDPFFTTKQVGKGTGLGLSISYDLIRKHGGTIGAESEVGRGTTFTIRLPLGGEEDDGEA